MAKLKDTNAVKYGSAERLQRNRVGGTFERNVPSTKCIGKQSDIATEASKSTRWAETQSGQLTLPHIAGSRPALDAWKIGYTALSRSLAEIGEDTMGDCQVEQLGDTIDSQLAHDRRASHFNGTFGQSQFGGY